MNESSNENDGPSDAAACHLETIKETCMNEAISLKYDISEASAKIDALEKDLQVNLNHLEEQYALALKLEVEEKKKIKFYKPINLFATPYFRDAQKSVPPPNEDSLLKKKNHDIDAHTLPPRPWTLDEHESLRSAVTRTAKLMMLDPLKNRQEYFLQRLEHGKITEDHKKEVKEKLESVREEIQKVEKMSSNELLETTKPLDWLRVVSIMDSTTHHRTPEECERMWKNFLHPSINKKKWTPEEDCELERVVKANQLRNWSLIASQLTLSKRTAIQCLERYQSKLNKSMLKSAWTPEDDKELIKVVNLLKVGDSIPWNQVQYHIDGRTRLQILNRWTRVIDPTLKKTPWSSQEDAVLLAAVDKYGYHWTKIRDLLPGRSDSSCRERYTNVLLPDTKVGSWNPEEDQILIKAIKLHGYSKWSRIASFLPGRTASMCLTRYKRIKKHHPHLFEESGTDTEKDFPPVKIPTNRCKCLKEYRSAVRSTAETIMLEAIMKLKGCTSHEEARDAMEGPKTSYAFLCALTKELLGGEQNSVKRKALSRMPVRPRTVAEGSTSVGCSRSSSGQSNIVRASVSSGQRGVRSFRPSTRVEDLFENTDSDSDEESISSDSSDENFDDDVDNDDDKTSFVDEPSSHLHIKTEEEKMVDLELESRMMPVVSYKIKTSRRPRGQSVNRFKHARKRAAKNGKIDVKSTEHPPVLRRSPRLQK